ncbi:hypothetical protein ACJMK2_029559 [Sinanodonta woodiana]|uniref:THAP-type domain-containing protein n=1 Tax=Sinanodonta woodiana TaxID=1069815 RepID=A0ABD3XCF3_SINWO
MGRDYCTVFGCHSLSGRIGQFGHKVTLHKLPKEQYARRAWIRAISRKNWIPSNYTRVCSDHFISENINHSNELNIFYTGLPECKTFHALFETLIGTWH